MRGRFSLPPRLKSFLLHSSAQRWPMGFVQTSPAWTAVNRIHHQSSLNAVKKWEMFNLMDGSVMTDEGIRSDHFRVWPAPSQRGSLLQTRGKKIKVLYIQRTWWFSQIKYETPYIVDMFNIPGKSDAHGSKAESFFVGKNHPNPIICREVVLGLLLPRHSHITQNLGDIMRHLSWLSDPNLAVYIPVLSHHISPPWWVNLSIDPTILWTPKSTGSKSPSWWTKTASTTVTSSSVNRSQKSYFKLVT